MLLTAAGLLVITLDPSNWLVGFSLVSLAYAMACSALWILVPEFVPVASLGLAFSICHVINDVVIMVFETRIGHALDQGKTFQDAILPLMVGFSLLATLATLLLMRPLRQRAEWNAALAAQGEAEGRRGAAAEATWGLQMMGSLGGSLGDLYD